jgi:hypothetical protein
VIAYINEEPMKLAQYLKEEKGNYQPALTPP